MIRPRMTPPTHEQPFQLRPPIDGPGGVRTLHDIEFAAAVGHRPTRMDLMIPPSLQPTPVVVYIHGGAFKFGSRHRNAVSGPLWDALLQAGIAVAAVEYRLSGEAAFPACLHDVKAAVRWLRAYGEDLGVRSDAIGAWGESAGGHLASFLALNNDDLALNGSIGVGEGSSDVQAVVAWYPPTDFLTMDDQGGIASSMSHNAADSPESELIRGALQQNRAAAAFASPVTHATTECAPLLLMHGLQDTEVPYGQSVELRDVLAGLGVPVELDLVPDAAHVFHGVDRAPLIARSVEFLATHLS